MAFRSDTLWEEAAKAVVTRFAANPAPASEALNLGNALVVAFLEEVESRIERKDDDDRAEQHARQLKRAASFLKQEQLRCYDAVTLSKVKFFGDITVGRVVKHLWSKQPPPPLNEAEREAYAAVKQMEKADSKAKREAKAAAKAQASGGALSGGTSLAAAQGGVTGPAPKAKGKRKAAAAAASVGVPGAAAAIAPGIYAAGGTGVDQEAGASQAEQPAAAKKRKQTPKEYVPAVGSANYAFLIVLYMSMKQGNEHETKQSLMQKAEASGLSSKSLFGVGAATNNTGLGGNAGKYYDGWSSVNKSLVNRTPPLLQVWSNPKKVRLTNEGIVLAAQLYKDAVHRCKITAVPGVDPDQDIAGQGSQMPAATVAAAPAAAAAPALPPACARAGGLPDQGRANARGDIGGVPVAACPEDDDGAIIISDSDDDMPGTAPAAEHAPASLGVARPAPGLPPLGRPVAARPVTEAAAAQASGRAYPATSIGAGGATTSGLGGSLGSQQPPAPRATASSGRAHAAAASQGGSQQTQGLSADQAVASHSGQMVGYRWCMDRLQDCANAAGPRLPPLPPGKTFAQVYKVVMVMDHREQLRREQGKSRTESLLKLVQRIRDKGVTVLVDQALPIGDVVWAAQSRDTPSVMYTLDYILERKSISDLALSIRDQRYGRQKYWMQLCGLSRPYYLIEGDVDMEPNLGAIERKAVKTAILSTQLAGFQLLHSAGPHPTLLLLASLTRAIERAYHGRTADGRAAMALTQPAEPLKTLQEWDAHVKQMQTRITVRDVFGLMLCAVPSLGEVLAEAILSRYQTWHELWGAYKQAIEGARAQGQDGHRAAEALLAGLPVRQQGSVAAGVRTVGPEASRKVYNTLFRADACASVGA